ncbi:HAD-IIIC family phosphatase [Achromobacter deleyi]|uniref:HAD-IIIC family phosphatase n=1 Tax=Achromobacter deleyi TaxID=1353891 RepID=UPI0014920663|nr:HAD-IIIC family phosphatase [Achromobacter deleyi]QVQ28234.1 HAD family hydrolase [Achromobacter deleyi]UIP18429.1 HAD-IIIC family phosphatase [Achromobacter deleyi]
MPELNWLPRTPDWPQALEEFSRQSEPKWSDLVKLANENLDFVQTAKLDKRLLKAFGAAPPATLTSRPIKLAVLGSSTTDQLLPGLRVGALRHNLWADIHVTPYAQYLREALDPSSDLHAYGPNAVLCAFDTQHLIGDETAPMGMVEANEKIASTIGNLRTLWRRLRESFNAQVIQQTLMPTHLALMGSNEQRMPGSGRWLLRRLNEALRQAADEEGVDILALDEQCEQDGLQAWHDPRLWLRAKQYVTPQASPAYGDLVARLIAARLGMSAKCLVLDLDNTLWGGVIGDDGVEKIVLGQGNGEGEAFAAFQRYARDMTRRGIILAVCSKNDEENALLPFTSHPEMVLKREDIACFVANWQDKASNLRSIAQRLNIGLDALVFVDDNPFERNLVRRELPMVRVPEMPEDPALYGATVSRAGYFESTSLTDADRERAHQYQANIEREALRTSQKDLASYLQSLNMVLEWNVFNTTDLQRIVQLIGKTNQFNLTTRRHGEDDVRAMMRDPRSVLLHFRLKDSFGDNGIIAIIAALPDASGDWRIDTWLMSCRVLGREVERATLGVLVDEARRAGAKRLIGEYLPTPKNTMVKDHYRKLGFSLLNENENATQWVLDLDVFTPPSAPMKIRSMT